MFLLTTGQHRKKSEDDALGDGVFSPLQETLFPIFNEYTDLLYTTRTWQNASEIRALYVLHALNHTLK
jgi:hypothetical protein